MNKVYLNADKVIPVGSRVTCNPAPTDTDIDYLVLASKPYEFRNIVFAEGYDLGGSLVFDVDAVLFNEDRFSSYTKGNINLIVTADENFFNKFIIATHVAKRLNLLQKQDRITLFQAILYGNMA